MDFPLNLPAASASACNDSQWLPNPPASRQEANATRFRSLAFRQSAMAHLFCRHTIAFAACLSCSVAAPSLRSAQRSLRPARRPVVFLFFILLSYILQHLSSKIRHLYATITVSIPCKKGRKTVGFSSKVAFLTTRLYKKTHAQNYSTDTLPCTAPFANGTAPTPAGGGSDAVPDGAGDNVGIVAMDGKRGQCTDAATLDAHAYRVGSGAVGGGAGTSARR